MFENEVLLTSKDLLRTEITTEPNTQVVRTLTSLTYKDIAYITADTQTRSQNGTLQLLATLATES